MKFARLITTTAVVALLCATGCSRTPAPAVDCAALSADLEPLLGTTWSDASTAAGVAQTLLAIRRNIERQLVPHDQWVTLGWCAYRAERFDTASMAFEESLARVRHSVDAPVGLGYIALRQGEPDAAVNHLAAALERDRDSADALEGLLLAIEQLPHQSTAAGRARETVDAIRRDRPEDPTLLLARTTADRKAGGSGELRRRAAAETAAIAHFARAGSDYLEVRDADGQWRPLYVKGINIGPALPGRFAAEAPPDEATWSQWLADIAALGANAVRVYTLQPPAFYRALARHNARTQASANPDAKRLWLLQGVWTDLPHADDFGEAVYLRDVQSRIARVIDAVHGDLVLSAPHGHAQGLYDTDVSAHTLAWIIGREWEPFAVVGYNRQHPGPCGHAGRFIQVREGNAMECWIGATLDFAAAYEARRYGSGRPLTFANWPTLDPLHHPTEATFAERDRWRLEREGIPIPPRLGPIWNDDEASVDATHLTATGAFAPGVFAAYHVYPNFPYFMNLEPAFGEVRDAEGVNRFAAYLRALKRHHGRQPVLVAEFGMSTSRGIAHLQPEGLHHGGQHEPEAMHQIARLARSVHDESMAGGLVFEFVDEWFKGTWTTNPFEVPEERRPFWFSAESPEQSYGLWAARPAAPVRLVGAREDWAAVPVLAASSAPAGTDGWSSLRTVRATYDAGYLYLLLETAGSGTVDWTRTRIAIGLDTYAPERGERALPAPAACPTATGVEFVVVLAGPEDSALLATPPYRKRHPWEVDATGMLASPLEPTGRYELPELTTNHLRYTRDGIRIAPQAVTPGRLRFGTLDPADRAYDTRTDVVINPDQGLIEVRLPWGLLNFADPSRGRVLHQPEPSEHFGTATTDGIRLYACAADRIAPAVLSALPATPDPGPLLTLESWEAPAYRIEPKQGLEQVAETFRALPDHPAAKAATNQGDTP